MNEEQSRAAKQVQPSVQTTLDSQGMQQVLASHSFEQGTPKQAIMTQPAPQPLQHHHTLALHKISSPSEDTEETGKNIERRQPPPSIVPSPVN